MGDRWADFHFSVYNQRFRKERKRNFIKGGIKYRNFGLMYHFCKK